MKVQPPTPEEIQDMMVGYKKMLDALPKQEPRRYCPCKDRCPDCGRPYGGYPYFGNPPEVWM